MPFVRAAAQPLKQSFEIAGNRANLGHRRARFKSELDAGHVAETASQITEPAIPSAGAAHLYHRLTITTLRLGAWTLMLRAHAALSAAGPCSLGSMNCPLCKPSTAMAAKCCSTFRRKLVFRESPCLCSRESD